MASLKINYLKQLKHPSPYNWPKGFQIGKTSFDIESVIFDENKTPYVMLLLSQFALILILKIRASI